MSKNQLNLFLFKFLIVFFDKLSHYIIVFSGEFKLYFSFSSVSSILGMRS